MSDNLEPIRALALAVLKRATDDLTVTYGRDASEIRRDAFRFLTDSLWSETCLWRAILGDLLVQRTLLRVVYRKVHLAPDGEVVVIRA